MRTVETVARQAGAALIAVSLAGAAARADQVALRSGRVFKQTVIQDVRGGRLHHRTSGGQIMSADLPEVMTLERERDLALNQAERHFVAGRFAEAADAFQAVRDKPGAPWTARWALYRLILCHEQTGQFARAVGAYVELLGEMPEAGACWVPSKWPDASSSFLHEAAEQLDAVLAAGGEPAVVEAVRKLREQIEGAQAAAGGAALLIPVEEEVTPWDAALEQMRAALARRAYTQVIEISDQLIAQGIDAHIEWMLLWRGEAQFLTAQNADDYHRAALTLMRVVIHYPDCAEAAEAGYHAGVALERAGNQADAAVVLREAAERAQNDELRSRIELSLRRVDKKSSGAAPTQG